ncbi:MAG TPA: hypothetical protein VFH92_02165, partial [Phenylobacterium sp.]|nr:hypothetical protein [Phenylobacterium sp.]
MTAPALNIAAIANPAAATATAGGSHPGVGHGPAAGFEALVAALFPQAAGPDGLPAAGAAGGKGASVAG